MGYEGRNVNSPEFYWTYVWHCHACNVGKGQPLTPEQHEKLEAYAKEHNIPPENIRDLLATGNLHEHERFCPLHL